MRPPDSELNARIYTRIASEYDAMLDRIPGNARVRDAFRQVVIETVPSGSLLLDFGCGTGLDCQWYAGRGYRVLAYDNAPGMMAETERRCEAEIRDGRVAPIHATYADFPAALARLERPGAVVSNFGAMNHVTDLGALFDALADRMDAGTPIVASFLNPSYWRDFRQPWWWVWYLRGLITGRIDCAWEDTANYRHFPRSIVRAAHPHFRLESRRAFRGLGMFRIFSFRRQ